MSSHSDSIRTTEQIITQFQVKTLQTILSSRIPRLSDPHPNPIRTRKRDKWFNLALPNLHSTVENETAAHGFMDPIIIDVILSPNDVILERWVTSCDSPTPPNASAISASKTYKKSILLIRSLYSLLRVLPCFKIYKLLDSLSRRNCDYDVSYRVSSFVAPFTREEEAVLESYAFAPVETQFGYLSLNVTYRASLSEFESGLVSSMAERPLIIPDYVGSPAADPLRAFPALPAARHNYNYDEGSFKPGSSPFGSRPISFPTRGRVGPNSATTRNDYEQPHSWSQPIDVYGNNRIPSRRNSGLSPPLLSNSPTPSPPTYGSSGNNNNYTQSRMGMETAPVSIPNGFSGKSQVYRTPNHSDPTRGFLPPPSPRNTRMEQSSHESQSLDVRIFRKPEGLKLGDFYSNLHMYTAQKGHKDGREDSGRFSGVFSSNGSPRLGFSRSSSRLSIQDDLDDDIEFSCPFAVDDVDTSDMSYPQSRKACGKEAAESYQSYNSSHTSQDAAVGALVHMLRTAPPLRQDPTYSSQHSRSHVNSEMGSSSFFMSRKTSDALQELKTYKEMKEVLLSQSRTESLG